MATSDFAQFDSKVVTKFLTKLTTNITSIDKRGKKYIGVISALVYADVIDHFRSEEGDDGPWEAWRDAYQTHMEKIGKAGNKKLQDTGSLRQQMTPIKSGGNARTNKLGIEWYNAAKTGSGFPYAYAHDNDEEPRKQLARRSFMWLSDKGLAKISTQTLSFILGEK